VNSQQLQALPAQPVRYVAQDSGPSMDLLKTACPVCFPSAAFSCSQMLLPLPLHSPLHLPLHLPLPLP